MKLAVLVSGNGSNLQALIDASLSDPEFGADISVVISDRVDAFGLQRAAKAGIATETVNWTDRTIGTDHVIDLLDRYGIDAVVLAGFMRILGPAVIARYPRRIINIHPSLLPAFPGKDAIGAAIQHGVKVTGVTVHFVDEEVDHGPIIAQKAVEVIDGDDRDSLSSRIQAQEHLLLPAVVKSMSSKTLASEFTGSATWS
jgi:phosphoribosylglycinamide formyltransferase-1